MDWHLIHSFIIEQLQIIQDQMQDDAYVLRYYDTLDRIITANPPQEPEHEVWLLLNRIFQNMNNTSLDQLDDKLLTREHVTDLTYCNLDIRETIILMKAAVKEDASATDRSRYAAHISSTIQANTPRG